MTTAISSNDKPPQHQRNVPFTPAAPARKKDSCTVQRTVGHCEGACLPQPSCSNSRSWTSSPRPTNNRLRNSSTANTRHNHHRLRSPEPSIRSALPMETKTLQPDYSPTSKSWPTRPRRSNSSTHRPPGHGHEDQDAQTCPFIILQVLGLPTQERHPPPPATSILQEAVGRECVESVSSWKL